MSEKTINSFEEDLIEFIKTELQEQFPEICPMPRITNGKIEILTYGPRLEKQEKEAIFKAITDRFFSIRKFTVGLDDRFNLGAALENL